MPAVKKEESAVVDPTNKPKPETSDSFVAEADAQDHGFHGTVVKDDTKRKPGAPIVQHQRETN